MTDMNDMTRASVIQKLGTLMFANAELGATNEMLLKLVHEQKRELDLAAARIKELEAREGPEPDGDKLAAGGEANGAATH